jgi:tetratricopeptide (TPR) repeat protein
LTQTRLESLKQLLVEDPNDSFTRYAIALEYNWLGEPETAINFLREVIDRDATYLPAYHQLGQICIRLNRTEEAKQIYKKGIELAQATGDTHAKEEMTEELEELEDEWWEKRCTFQDSGFNSKNVFVSWIRKKF